MNNYSAKACTEIAEILDHIPKKLYERLPKEIINYFYQNRADKCEIFEYNVALPIWEQNISEETREILKFIEIIFWRLDDFLNKK